MCSIEDARRKIKAVEKYKAGEFKPATGANADSHAGMQGG